MQLTLMTVHAHPDDETIGTGGVLARCAEAGVRTIIVCSTNGEEGEIVDPELNRADIRAQLGTVRRQELLCAAHELGVGEVRFLGYYDSGMDGTPENKDPKAFMNADFSAAVEKLVAIMREVKPQVVVTYNEHGGYGHPDHIMTHRITVAAFDAAGDANRFPAAGSPWQPFKLYYIAVPRTRLERMIARLQETGKPSPFEGKAYDIDDLATPDAQITTHVDVRATLEQRRRALLCHRTQIARDAFFLEMPPDLAAEAFGTEHFVLVKSLVPTTTPEEDLFQGVTG